MRLMALKLVDLPWQHAWQWKVEIDGLDEADVYVKDISFGPIEIETEPEKAGMHTLTFPSGTAPVGISMTMRDHQDQRVYEFLKAWAAKIVNPNGTVNLAKDFVKKWKRYSIDDSSAETLRDTWEVFLTQLGDISESKEEPGILEFPVTLVQFKS